MRRITLWVLSTVTAVVLLLSYRTSTSSSFASAMPASVQQATSSSNTSGTAASGSGTGGSTKKKTSTATQSFTGNTFYNQFGAVQVQITVTGGKITAAQAVQYPNGDPRSQEINAYAVPALDDEVVQAQSANIAMVSGASFTSYDYLQSLQSAIDQANL